MQRDRTVHLEQIEHPRVAKSWGNVEPQKIGRFSAATLWKGFFHSALVSADVEIQRYQASCRGKSA